MLTQRQIRLLMLLASERSWVTAAMLAERLSVSVRVVKQEVVAIRELLGDRARIESAPRKGYRIGYLEDGLRDSLAKDFDVHEGHHSIKRRYAQVFLMLLLGEWPLSMAQVAERLFVSKATVAEQVQIMRYRMTRLPRLHFEIDVAGLRIAGAESERRYEASKWIEDDRIGAMFEDDEDVARFHELHDVAAGVAERCLEPLVATGRLSGSDVRRVGDWCALSAVRGALGHCVEEPFAIDQEDAHASEMKRYAKALHRALFAATGVDVDEAGTAWLAQLLVELTVPLAPSDAARSHAAELLSWAAEQTGSAGLAVDEAALAHMAARIDGVMRRTARGHSLLNYHASETVARYPQASYLAATYLARAMPGHVSKAEATLVALGLASAIERQGEASRAVLYTDENTAVIGHLRALVASGAVGRVHIEAVRPVDFAAPAEPGVIELTTDPSSALRHPAAHVLPAMPDGRDLAHLARELTQERAVRLETLGRRLLRDVLPERNNAVAQACSGRPCGYTLLTAYRTICAVKRQDTAPSTVDVCRLREPLLYRGKRYRRTIEVRWNTADVSAADLFEILSQLLLQEYKDRR